MRFRGSPSRFRSRASGTASMLPRLLGWNIHQNDDYFLAFLVATHVATATCCCSLPRRLEADRSRVWGARFAIARSSPTTPARGSAGCWWWARSLPGTLGLLLEHPLRSLFASPASAAAFLIVNGILLLTFERLRRRPSAARRLPRRLRRPDRQAQLAPGGGRRHRAGGGARPRASRAPGSRWAAASCSGSRTRTQRGIRSCSPRRSSARPACSSCPDLFGSAGNGVRGPALVGALCAAADHLPGGQVPAAVLPDQPADAVRHLLHRRGPDLHGGLRARLRCGSSSFRALARPILSVA